MKAERLKVLEILQEGKINAEEASRLLEVLNKMPEDDDADEDCVQKVVKVQMKKAEDV